MCVLDHFDADELNETTWGQEAASYVFGIYTDKASEIISKYEAA